MEDLLRTGLSNALAAALMGAVVATLSPLLSRRPAILHALWALVLLKLVTPPLFEVPVERFRIEPAAVAIERPAPVEDVEFEPLDWLWVDSPEVVTFRPAVAESRPPAAADDAAAWRLLGGVWLAGALATALVAGSRIHRFQRRLRDVSPAGIAVEDEVAALAAGMGLRRVPRVDVVDARVPPMVWTLGKRARLILPRSLWKGLDARRRTLLLTHELAHLKRGDHRLRLLELAATVLYWWLPVVWWTRRALRDVEEQCCDAWVVWMFPDDARAYAETLLDAVDFLTPDAAPAPLLASGFGKARHLRRRLTMVMQGKTPRTLGWKGSLGALALAGVLLPLGPAWAQKAPDGESARTFTFTDDNKLEAPKATSFTYTFSSADGREGIEKAIEELKGRVKELESQDPKKEGSDVQIEALKSVLRTLETIAAEQRVGEVEAEGRPDEPKLAAARKKVEELQKDLNVKRREMAEAARKLVDAERELARLGGRPFGPRFGFGGSMRGFGPMGPMGPGGPMGPMGPGGQMGPGGPMGPMGPMLPGVAEGRGFLRDLEGPRDKARVEALEKKLDQVLKQLEKRQKSKDDGEE